MNQIDSAIALSRTAAHAGAEKGGINIVALDVSTRLALTDAFVLISGTNERQVGAIVDAVERALQEEHGVKRLRREGNAAGRWVLLDFGEIVVHVFHTEDREFYGIERLWNDSPVIDVAEAVRSAEQPS